MYFLFHVKTHACKDQPYTVKQVIALDKSLELHSKIKFLKRSFILFPDFNIRKIQFFFSLEYLLMGAQVLWRGNNT